MCLKLNLVLASNWRGEIPHEFIGMCEVYRSCTAHSKPPRTVTRAIIASFSSRSHPTSITLYSVSLVTPMCLRQGRCLCSLPFPGGNLE